MVDLIIYAYRLGNLGVATLSIINFLPLHRYTYRAAAGGSMIYLHMHDIAT